jgi:cell division protein FtsA
VNIPFHYHSIKGRKGSVAVLDVGSSKIACFIAEPNEQGELQIVGIGHHHAQGIRAGTITDSHAAEASIAAAVSLAEKMAGGVTVDNVMVNLALPDIRSHLMHVDLNISGGSVSEQDISDILREGCQSVAEENQQIIHCFATQYQLDGAKGIRDPRHMYGMMLKADLHVITVDSRKVLNLANTISRCHLDIAEFVASPHAAGLGCLEPDEQELGVTLIDMGAAETSVALFSGGANIYSFVIPIGGAHVTKDLAQGLSTGIAHAERLKSLHGSVLASANDEQSMVHVPLIGEENANEETTVPRAQLVSIIRPRVEEIFELILDHLEEHHLLHSMGQHVVLTGGASQLVGVRELATTMFGKQVRLGKPKAFAGLAESVSSAGFSAAVGMLHYARSRPFEEALLHPSERQRSLGSGQGVKRLLGWLKERF